MKGTLVYPIPAVKPPAFSRTVLLCARVRPKTPSYLCLSLMTSDVYMLQLKLFLYPLFCDSTRNYVLCMSHGNIQFSFFDRVLLTSIESLFQLFNQPSCALFCASILAFWHLVGSSPVCVEDEMLWMPQGCLAIVSHLYCPLSCWFAVLLATFLPIIPPVKLPHAQNVNFQSKNAGFLPLSIFAADSKTQCVVLQLHFAYYTITLSLFHNTWLHLSSNLLLMQ